jgi:hypothetical protein
VEIITDNLEVLQAPPSPKRFKNIWKHELELAVEDKQNLLSPDYNEIKRQRKRKKITVKPKRKTKKIKKRGKR